MRAAIIILAFLGLILLLGATLAASGHITVRNGGWLEPGGLAMWLAAWLLSKLAA